MAGETTQNETKKATSIAELAKAFERDGTMEPGYEYQYRRTVDGNAELVVTKKG